ncbi:MAG: undecaprenyl-diphosphate phosphatase [Oscillospiraceae bacterium]|nr:undecaprenyl-diphosphate phosphatase [Oscillospiraceae bacterium]
MTLWDAVIQAVIQGLTEFLPVSSSGHLKLYQAMTGQTVAEGTFLLVILHLGTLAAVCMAFRGILRELCAEAWAMLRGLLTGTLRRQPMTPQRRMLLMLCISTALLVPFYLIKDVFEQVTLPVLGVCFLFTSIELFFAGRFRDNTKTAGDMRVRDAVLIGLFQCAALFPGISRSGSTISGGLFAGLEKETAVQYSFVLGIPAILGGCAAELLSAARGEVAVNLPAAGIGFLVSAAAGIFAIRFVRALLRSDRFTLFSVYTLGVSILTFCCWIYSLKAA